MARPAIAVALPLSESTTVSAELLAAGFEVIEVEDPRELEKALDVRRDIALAVLDGEIDAAEAEDYDTVLRGAGRPIPALTVVSPRAFERLVPLAQDGSLNEYFTRPYSADSIRWRVEAMCIRRETVDDGSGPILQGGDPGSWRGSATTIAVFNPKGGVGKTTVATNLAAALQVRKGKSVLLIDADTVTGHVTTSLGIEGVRTRRRQLARRGRGRPDRDPRRHRRGAPVRDEGRGPDRLAAQHRRPRPRPHGRRDSPPPAAGVDVIVIDLHPSYSTLNQAIFDVADRILVPVTPDVPAIRAAVQLRDVAVGLGCRERLAMVINRANSGLGVADMERTVGMPGLALIRSGGLLFVRAANEGRTVIEMFPKEKITTDFDVLADRVLGTPTVVPAAKAGFRICGPRPRQPARA